MKKYYYLLIVALLAAITVSLTACGDDEPSSSLEKQLIGEWNDGPSSLEVFYLKFNSNHTGKFWVVVNDMGGIIDCEIDFKWSVNGDILTLKGNDPELYDCVFEQGRFYFQNDKLYLPDADLGGGLILHRSQE